MSTHLVFVHLLWMDGPTRGPCSFSCKPSASLDESPRVSLTSFTLLLSYQTHSYLLARCLPLARAVCDRLPLLGCCTSRPGPLRRYRLVATLTDCSGTASPTPSQLRTSISLTCVHERLKGSLALKRGTRWADLRSTVSRLTPSLALSTPFTFTPDSRSSLGSNTLSRTFSRLCAYLKPASLKSPTL